MSRLNSDKEVYYVENVNDLPEKLYDFLRPHDMFITMGAGNIYTAGEKLIELIKEKGIASDYKNSKIVVLMGGPSTEAEISKKQVKL